MAYKFELILVIKKKKEGGGGAHKYKFVQTLSSSNFIYRVKYIIKFFIDIYIGHLVFYTKLTHLTQKLNNKKKT